MAVNLISGGAGFIGSHLVERLLERGEAVIVVDNLITGRYENIEHLDDNDEFSFIKSDVCEQVDIDNAPDNILHLASPASPVDFQSLSVEILLTGSRGTYNLLEIARDSEATFLLASSSEVYGDAEEHPQTEDYWGNVNPVGIRSPYDEAKRFAESLTISYRRKFDLNTHIARIFNTYGPRMRMDDGRVIPNFIKQVLTGEPLTIYGDGTQTRSFCYIDDMVEGLLKLLTTDYHYPVNLGNPKEFTILELAELVCEVAEVKPEFEYQPLPEDDPSQRKPDITLAKDIINWEPAISLKDGLKETIVYFEGVLG